MSNPKVKKRSREEIAKIEIGNTDIGRAGKSCLCVFFLLLIFVYPCIQILHEAGSRSPLRQLPSLSLFARLGETGGSPSLMAFNRNLTAAVKQYEDELETSSILQKLLLPPTQYLLSKYFHLGNEKVVIGKGGHLFYRHDIKYLSSPGFLDSEQLREGHLTGRQADPLPAILDFHRQLKERGVKLVIMPAPVKPMLYPEQLGAAKGALNNRSFELFKAKLEEAGVSVIDLCESLTELRGKGKEVFLKTDTHWTPEAMRAAAELIAKNIGGTRSAMAGTPQSLSSRGDLARMLNLPSDSKLIEPENISLTIHDKVPERQSEILLLGDSFCNIFSSDALHWGSSAGLPETLAALLGQGIDLIARNDAGAYASRELLARELARGRDRLAGKKLLVWEFVSRELMEGDWKIIPLELRETGSVDCFSVEQPTVIEATLAAVSLRPRPYSAPYSDHVMALHLVDINDGLQQALVYMVSMENNKLTGAAKLRQNERVKIRVMPWVDCEERYGTWSRSEINDDELLLWQPLWGEMP